MLYVYRKPINIVDPTAVTSILFSKLTFSVTSDTIKISNEQNKELYSFTKDELARYNSGSVLCFYFKDPKAIVEHEPTKDDFGVYDSLSLSYNTHDAYITSIANRMLAVARLFYLVVPSKEESFINMDFVFMLRGDTKVNINLPEMSITNTTQFFEDYLPVLETKALNTVTSNAETEIDVYVKKNNSTYTFPVEVFATTDCGYLNKTRATSVDGVAKFKFIPLGLGKGDVATIKFGFKYFTKRTECTVVITD